MIYMAIYAYLFNISVNSYFGIIPAYCLQQKEWKMKAIIVMYDSLVKNLLSAYGCTWTKTPNFKRLAEKSICFENCYAGSLPCMPARRELHTGRYNFLNRSWGPLEPFDISMPAELNKSGIHTHLVSDHYHYWEDGGASYHTKYSTWEIVRGQEGDKWKGSVQDPQIPSPAKARKTHRWRQDWVNREYIKETGEYPQIETFRLGLEFIEKNAAQDNWLLQIESFSPHEPYFFPDKFKELYPHDYNGPFFDWPPYKEITDETKEEITHIRCQYAAVLSMCDYHLGLVLDAMDNHDLWKDTLLLVNTDHGFMLGEHGWLGKNVGPTFNEIANIPLFIWDPRYGIKNERRQSLVQTIDIVPTIYNYFNIEIPKSVLGKDISPLIKDDTPIRTIACYGSHGGNLNCRVGNYIYMLAPDKDNDSLYNYTLDCFHMCQPFSKAEMDDSELVGPFDFSNGYKVLKVKKIKPANQSGQLNLGSFLYDLSSDPEMNNPIHDESIERYMKKEIVKVLKENDTPLEVYARYGLSELLEEGV